MSDERKRPDGWATVLDAWPAPEPTAGFADRVLAACGGPPAVKLSVVREPARRRSTLGGVLVCAAIAAAVVFIPIAVHRRRPPSNPASVASINTSFDLGSEHD
ncbi:MAG: hypothetical protein JWN44_224 [Myxococcales bacterium]|nr:hypothetical protein [Myxococcales bacterium]